MFVSLLALGELEDWALFPVLLILSREFLITGLRLVAAGKGKTLAAEKIETEDDRSTYLHLSLFRKNRSYGRFHGGLFQGHWNCMANWSNC